MLNVTAIPAFMDNYIWCIFDDHSRQAIIVDPGSAQPVLAFLASKQLQLSAVFITHHHPDHTGGVNQLKAKFDCSVYGYQHAKFKHIDQTFIDGDRFSLLGTSFTVYEVPGHTLDHIAFYSASDDTHSKPWLFCGDTLFSGGCGRLFEGSAEQMQASLNTLSKLPETSEIYCAHEYTIANLTFALSLMPENRHLQRYMNECKEKRDRQEPTIPSTIATELKINPFLRSHDQALIQAISALNPGLALTPTNIFSETRKAKDRF